MKKKLSLFCVVIMAFMLFPFLSFAAGEATVSWQANTEPDLEGYRVYYGTAPGSYGPFVPAGTNTSKTITDLDDGETYYFVVTAVDQAGNESGYSSPPASKTIDSESSPSSPVLSSPSSGSNQTGTSVSFSWNASPGATDYDLYIWSSSGRFFDKWLGNVTSYSVSGFPNDGTLYSWCVIPRNSFGVGDRSEKWSFNNGSFDLPETPTLLSPSDGIEQPGDTISFSWAPVPGATNYDLYIWSSSGRFFDKWLGNVTSYSVSGFPNDGTLYAWCVYPRNSSGVGDRSEKWSFNNGSFDLPETPTLLSPSDGIEQPGDTISFSWAPVPGATNYDLYIWSSSGRFFDKWLGNVTSYSVSGFPNDGTLYAWCVYPKNSFGVGEHSAIWRFNNGSFDLPGTPTLSSPSNGIEQPGDTISFSWAPVPGATDYDLYIWSSSGKFFDKWLGNVTSYSVSGFPNDGTLYAWCVYPKNSFGVGEHSAIWRFNNGSFDLLGTPTLSSPSNGIEQPGDTISFSWAPVPGATDYDLYIWSSSGRFFDKWLGNVTSYEVPDFPNDGTLYAWCVYPRNSFGVGEHSEIWSFNNGQ